MLRSLTALAVAALFAPMSARAATITVTTTDDERTVDGDCSLREAIDAANTDAAVDACPAGSGEDEIVLAEAGYGQQLQPGGEDENAGGDFDVTSPVTIRGVGQERTLLVGNVDRYFDVRPGGSLVLQDLTIAFCTAVGGSSDEADGAGGAIRALGDLRVERSGIGNNMAAPSRPGGAIFATANLDVVDTWILDNTGGPAPLNSSQTGGWGGGIYAIGSTHISGSTLRNNHVGTGPTPWNPAAQPDARGAAIYARGNLEIDRTSIEENGSGPLAMWGGGVFVETRPGSNGSFVRIHASTLRGNTAERGAALSVFGFTQGVLFDSTVTENVGGSVFNPSGGSAVHLLGSAQLQVVHSTIAGNEGIGVAADSSSGSRLSSSILARNRIDGAERDCVGAHFTFGYNLFGSGGGCQITLTDLETTDPRLEPAAGEDGAPWVMALKADSPAIDAGRCEDESWGTFVADQRGVEMPQGSTCDIGAYEFIPYERLERTTEVAPGGNCAYGGNRSDSGLDSDRDGTLDDEEIDRTTFACNGAPGSSCSVETEADGSTTVRCDDGTVVTIPASADGLVRVEAEPAGENCASGGQRIVSGTDDDGDGVLDPEEIESTSYACNGASCTVESKGGNAVIRCDDGTATTVKAPEDGGCSAAPGSLTLFGLLAAIGLVTRQHRPNQ